MTITAGGSTLDFSLKNFGGSEHEAAAHRAFKQVLSTYVTVREGAPSSVAGLAVFANRYPSSQDWKQLLDAAPQLARTILSNPTARVDLGDCWSLVLHSLPSRFGEYAVRPVSYQLVMVIPHHQNEHANLIGYLDTAARNARKYARAGDDTARALFIRFRESAALSHYAAWASEYLAENSEGPLDGIFLYQPTFTFTPTHQHAIHHAFVAVTGPKLAAWQSRSPSRVLHPRVAIGLTGGPVDRKIQVGGHRMDPGPSYTFQRGEYFISFGNQGTVNLLAPGIQQHAIMNIDGVAPIILKGKFPEEDGLDLFD